MMLNGWKILNYNWKYMRTVSIKTREPEYKSLETEKPSKIRIRTKVNWGGSQEQDTEKNTFFFCTLSAKNENFYRKKLKNRSQNWPKPENPVFLYYLTPKYLFVLSLILKQGLSCFRLNQLNYQGFVCIDASSIDTSLSFILNVYLDEQLEYSHLIKQCWSLSY